MERALVGVVDSGLDAALAQLLARSGGQAVRLVDGRSARVLGRAGWSRPEDVTALVRLAAQALPVAAADGGLTDLVVTAGRVVHVLRPGPAVTVLVLRLAAGDDLDTARRVLAAPQTFGALSAAMPIRPVPSPVSGPVSGPVRLPVQRGPHSVPVPAPRGGSPALHPGQPALSALSGVPRVTGRTSTGALAALALGAAPLSAVPQPAVPQPAVPRPAVPQPAVPLPRRPQEQVVRRRPEGVGDWAQDVATMRRVLAGLRRLG